MKRNFKFASLALGAMMAGVLGSCTAENGYLSEPTTQPANAVNLFKATEINAFSNGISFDQVARTYGAYMNANMYDQDWDCVPNVDLTAEQLEELKELFRKGVETHNTIVLPFENYWVQQVYKGQAPDEAYTPTDINGNPVNGTTITGSNQMDKLVAYNEKVTNTNYGGYWDSELNQYVQVITEDHYEHVNNFNNGNNTNNPGQCGCGIVHEGTTLMINMDADNVDPEEQFGFHESFGTSHNYNNYIIIEYPEGSGDWYVGFDYEMHKNEAQNANEAKDVERDWNFTDWIVKITPAYHKGETPEEPWRPEETTQPETPTTPDTPSDDCPKCHHPKHEGNCPDCEEGEICNPIDHVEVNFEVEEHQDYLATHLSIHVRAATDVEVFIPVPRKYYVEADDMAIVEQHLENSMSYGGFLTENKVERYVLGEYEITLTMTYEDDGIRVKTEGINEDVLAALNKVTGDGITFEIWNYYNDQSFKEDGEESIELETARIRLKKWFDDTTHHATIEFTKEPSLYVNAFFFDDQYDEEGVWTGYTGDENPWDCFVDIVSKQRDDYGDMTKGMFFNKSPFNKKYYKN